MLDCIIARLQNIYPFNIYEIQPDGSVNPWYEVVGSKIIPDLIIKETNLLEQVQIISAQIAHWGRLTAQAKRVWQIEDRKYRCWRDKYYLNILQSSEVGGKKKPTEKQIEAEYRNSAEYNILNSNIERAEESYNACVAILDGYRAKKEALRMAIYRRNEDGAAILSL